MAEPVEAAPEAALDFSELFSSKTKGGGQRVPRSSAKASTTGPGELSVAEAPPRVVLQQYASSPLINFGEIAPKKAVVRALAVANESGRTQKVEVKPFESRDAMRVYPMSFEVPAHGQKELTLTWTPGAAGVLSKRLDLKWNQSNAVHAELRGTCSKVQRAPPTMVLAPAVKSLVAELHAHCRDHSLLVGRTALLVCQLRRALGLSARLEPPADPVHVRPEGDKAQQP